MRPATKEEWVEAEKLFEYAGGAFSEAVLEYEAIYGTQNSAIYSAATFMMGTYCLGFMLRFGLDHAAYPVNEAYRDLPKILMNVIANDMAGHYADWFKANSHARAIFPQWEQIVKELESICKN